MSFFLVGHFEFFFEVLFFSNEVSFFSALWIVSSESWKRPHSN